MFGFFAFTFLCSLAFVNSVTPSCNCVFFRLDDVQDSWVTTPQMAIMDVFKAGKYPLSIGIIGNYFGSDPVIVNYTKVALQTSGWDFDVNCHEDFTTFTLAQQKTLISQATTKIVNALTPYLTTVKSFIPPYNSLNSNTLSALTTYGYTHVSSEVAQDPSPYYWSGQTLYHWPIQSQTSNQAETMGITAAETWTQIQSQLNTYGFAGVMMHPPEFSQKDSQGNALNVVNTTMITQLQQLIQLCLQNGLKLVTISSVEANVLPSTTGVSTTRSITSATVTTSPVTTRGVTTSPLTSAAVTTSPVTTSPLTTARLTTSPLTTSPLTTSPLTTSPLTTSPLTTSPLTTSPLTTSPLTTSPLTSGDITTSPLTTSPLTSGDITTSPLTTSPLTSGDITTSPVTSGDITTSPLTSGDITTSPVTSGEITTGELTTAHDPLGESEAAASFGLKDVSISASLIASACVFALF